MSGATLLLVRVRQGLLLPRSRVHLVLRQAETGMRETLVPRVPYEQRLSCLSSSFGRSSGRSLRRVPLRREDDPSRLSKFRVTLLVRNNGNMHILINNSNASRFILRNLADGWEFGKQARELRGPIGMTGTLRGDRRVLNDSARALVFRALESEIDRLSRRT